MGQSHLLSRLVEALRCLPGVGPKGAQRMAFYLLERDRAGGERLAEVLSAAMQGIGRCRICRNFSDNEVCPVCESPDRDSRTLCVVESPADVAALEQTGGFRGLYFVLMGHLSPLDGIGPGELGLDAFEARLDQGGLDEVILATNTTVEGEATALYLAELAHSHGVRATRIAHGVPLGGDLEFVDGGTLSHALAGRREV